MGDMDRILNAFLDGNIDPKTLEYYLSPESPYYPEWEEEQRRKKEEAETYRRPTGVIDKFLESKWSPSRGVYMDSDMPPVTGEWAQGGQDLVKEQVVPPNPPGMIPDPYGFDKIPGLIDEITSIKMVDRGRLERQAEQARAESGSGGLEMARSHPAPPQIPQNQGMDIGWQGPPQPPENLRAEQMWAQFQEMNPNLDYDAVVQQAGGIPGSFDSPMISEMPDSPERQAQVASLMDYVQNQIPRDEIARMQDKRSRAYDPGMAAQKIAMIKQDQDANASSAEAQIEKIKADAQMKNATAYETLAGRGQTAGGYPFGGQGADVGGVDSTVLKQVEMAVDSMSSRMTGNQEADDIIMSDIAQLKMLVAAGRLDEARKIYEKYAPRNPETAMPPPGVSELAGAEGSRPVTPTGGKYTTDPATGELVYVG